MKQRQDARCKATFHAIVLSLTWSPCSIDQSTRPANSTATLNRSFAQSRLTRALSLQDVASFSSQGRHTLPRTMNQDSSIGLGYAGACAWLSRALPTRRSSTSITYSSPVTTCHRQGWNRERRYETASGNEAQTTVVLHEHG